MMPTVELALQAINEVMNITNAYLYQVAAMDNLVIDGRNAGKNDKEIESTWIAEGDEVHSERIEVRA
jgi:translation initiation factor IF-1